MARFSPYDARKLLTPETIAHIESQFRLPADRTFVARPPARQLSSR
jgi:hypothetical protein